MSCLLQSFCLFFFLIYLFWLLWVFIAGHGLSLVAASWGHSSPRCAGLPPRWPLPPRSTGPRHMGPSSCGTQAQQLWLAGSRAQAQQPWRTGLAAPRHVGSSRTRARTHVPPICRRTPNHCATREVLVFLLNYHFLNLNYTAVYKNVQIKKNRTLTQSKQDILVPN